MTSNIKRSLEDFIKIFMDPRTLEETIEEQRIGRNYLIDKTKNSSENNFDITIDENNLITIVPNGKSIIPISIDYDELI